MKKLYRPRNPMELDKAGNYYSKHVEAMTSEGLHAKADIAVQLAYRDSEIDRLIKQSDSLHYDFEKLAATHEQMRLALESIYAWTARKEYECAFCKGKYPHGHRADCLLEKLMETISSK